ncbi:MAG: hypothetical protein ACFFCQ_15640, partial [Promethearchaeota archaeon]
VISIFCFLLLTYNGLYYTYAHKFEREYNGDSNTPLLEFNPLELNSEPFLFYILIFVLLPVLFFYLGYKLFVSKNIWTNFGYLSILFFCILLEGFLYWLFHLSLHSPL